MRWQSIAASAAGAILFTVCVFTAAQYKVRFEKQAEAMATPKVEDVQVTCATTATLISPGSGKGHMGCECQNNSATAVHAGDSGMATASTPKYCNDTATCLRGWWVAARDEYCMVASGTQAIECKCAVGF